MIISNVTIISYDIHSSCSWNCLLNTNSLHAFGHSTKWSDYRVVAKLPGYKHVISMPHRVSTSETLKSQHVFISGYNRKLELV